jgi:hypothetical protein
MAAGYDDEAHWANVLLDDAECAAPLIEIGKTLTPEFRARLLGAHERVIGCSARSEGLRCCVEVLAADPEDYSPEKIAAARVLVRQAWESRAR